MMAPWATRFGWNMAPSTRRISGFGSYFGVGSGGISPGIHLLVMFMSASGFMIFRQSLVASAYT